MKHTDGKVVDYMEDSLYRFMDTDFFGKSQGNRMGDIF